MGRGWIDYLLLPYRVAVEARHGDFRTFDGRLNPLWIVLLPLAAVVARSDQRVRRAVVFTATFFTLWALGSQQIRLLIPTLPHAAFAGGVAVAMVLRLMIEGNPGRWNQLANLPSRPAQTCAVRPRDFGCRLPPLPLLPSA